MEPWLDSLSEDWNSLPRSYISPQASQRTLASPKAAPTSGKKAATRIPRLKQARATNSTTASPAQAIPKPSPLTRKRILSERSVSDINISIPCSPAISGTKHLHIPLSPNSSSAGSDASVVKHEPVKPRSRSSSLPEAAKHITPEWKRLAHNPSSQLDLFRPLALETIFQQPQDSLPRKSHNRLRVPLDIDNMPSSPPPWPSNHSTSCLSSAKTNIRSSADGLYVMSEEDKHNMRTSGTIEKKQSREGSLPSKPLDSSVEHKSPKVGQESQAALRAEGKTSCTILRDLNCAVNSISAEGSSFNSGFSPVFVSKHNTVDGSVGYAALDLSNPELIKRLQSMSLSGSVENTTNAPMTPEIVPISSFVSVDRGGHSEEGSFRRRALSSSDLSSLVPSDSVSQVTIKTNTLIDQFPTPSNSISMMRRSLSADSTTKNRRRTPPPVNDSKTPDEYVHSSGSPLKLFGNYDTFTNNRLLRHMSRLDDSEIVSDHDGNLTSTKDNSHEMPNGSDSFGRETTIHPLNTLNDENSISPNKRPGSSPIKLPTPKRLRTLTQVESKGSDKLVAAFAQDQHHQLQAIIGKKRKDARYDDHQEYVDPDEIAKRQIIWPRRASFSHKSASNQANSRFPMSESLLSHQSELELVQAHIENLPLPVDIANPQQVRAIAAELATVRLNNLPHLNGEVRKHSVSTQDYLDEAMKIMDMIRSKAPTELALIQQFDFAGGETGSNRFGFSTPLTISRPPSREGPSVWRTANDFYMDPGIEDHLKKYREAEDESLMIESVNTALTVSEDHKSSEDVLRSDPPNVRIIEGRPEANEAEPTNTESIGTRSVPRTHSSHPSTDSTGRTTCTTSSQRNRTLPVILPEKVSHLINGEEAGMRFDKEKQTWIKYRNSPTKGEHLGSSSSVTEEDPFDQIPDLSVNETQEQLRVLSTDSVPSQPSEKHPDVCFANIDGSLAQNQSAETQRSDLKFFGENLENGQDYSVHMESPENSPQNSSNDVEEYKTTSPLPVSPSDTVRSRKRRDVSVLFSSPVVSHWRDPERWEGTVDLEQIANSQLQVSSNFEDFIPARTCSSSQLESNRSGVHQRRSQMSAHRNRVEVQSISFMGMEEHQEMSLIETRPDGRTVSLTLSVSTPMPANRALSSRLHDSSKKDLQFSSHSLSPLSDFTIHNDDKRHLESRQLIRTGNALIPADAHRNTAVSVSKLVEKITDAEPTELYWDSMRVLNLRTKELDTVNHLDNLCPELEHLDLSDNQLSQLCGAPLSIRSLRVSMNQLTSLTSWSHLRNLQYVDVSCNRLDNLDAFVDLVHLRELNAEQNIISNIEGILDLDGLMQLKLSGNQLQNVDFETCVLKSLIKLDLSQNNISTVNGLGWIPDLLELDLSKNKLKSFPTCDKDSVLRLKSLNLEGNQLESLDVAKFPDLENLNVDNNYLSTLNGVEHLEKLSTLSLRNQRSTITLSSFSAFSNISHLFLSGNHISNISLSNKSFLNLQTLELAYTGLQSIPPEFAKLCPNVRTLNLNANAIKDLKGIHGIRRLRVLVAAGNRLSKLRRTSKIVSSFEELEILDLRNNPFTVGFHPPPTNGSLVVRHRDQGEIKMKVAEYQHMLPDGNEESTWLYVGRLNEETKLKRRVYELLLATGSSSCLRKLDGLPFNRDVILCKDKTWERLMGLGIVERIC